MNFPASRPVRKQISVIYIFLSLVYFVTPAKNKLNQLIGKTWKDLEGRGASMTVASKVREIGCTQGKPN